MFTLLLGFTALLVAGCAAYFSVLGIATLFMGSYYQVMVMAGSLEIGKLVVTSYLYRYWNKTTFVLKTYLIIAVLTLMGITSLGVFGYLSAAYQVSASKGAELEQQITIVDQQKQTITKEIEQNNVRIVLLNDIRATQEKRVEQAGNYKAPREQAYAAIEKANEEIKSLTTRNQELNNQIIEADKKIGDTKIETLKNKDIGTFKFIAQSLGMPLDTIVKFFILIIVLVFDPLAVSLVLAFNVATRGTILKEEKKDEELFTPVVETESEETSQDVTTENHEKEPVTRNKIHVTGKLR